MNGWGGRSSSSHRGGQGRAHQRQAGGGPARAAAVLPPLPTAIASERFLGGFVISLLPLSASEVPGSAPSGALGFVARRSEAKQAQLQVSIDLQMPIETLTGPPGHQGAKAPAAAPAVPAAAGAPSGGWQIRLFCKYTMRCLPCAAEAVGIITCWRAGRRGASGDTATPCLAAAAVVAAGRGVHNGSPKSCCLYTVLLC